jgi:hypothetical protein
MSDLVLASFDAVLPREAWDRHVASLRQVPLVEGAALFRWIDGDAPWLALYDVTSGAATPAGSVVVESLSKDLEARVNDSTAYTEIFAAPDARPVEACLRYMHVPLVDFSARGAIEADFNRWYNETHVPQLVVAGLVHARRFRVAREAWQYAATYEIDSPTVLQGEALARVRGFGVYSDSVRGLRRILLERVDPLSTRDPATPAAV